MRRIACPLFGMALLILLPQIAVAQDGASKCIPIEKMFEALPGADLTPVFLGSMGQDNAALVVRGPDGSWILFQLIHGVDGTEACITAQGDESAVIATTESKHP